MKSNIIKNNKNIQQTDPISAEIIDRTDKLVSKQLSEDKIRFVRTSNSIEENNNSKSSSNIFVY